MTMRQSAGDFCNAAGTSLALAMRLASSMASVMFAGMSPKRTGGRGSSASCISVSSSGSGPSHRSSGLVVFQVSYDIGRSLRRRRARAHAGIAESAPGRCEVGAIGVCYATPFATNRDCLPLIRFVVECRPGWCLETRLDRIEDAKHFSFALGRDRPHVRPSHLECPCLIAFACMPSCPLAIVCQQHAPSDI